MSMDCSILGHSHGGLFPSFHRMVSQILSLFFCYCDYYYCSNRSGLAHQSINLTLLLGAALFLFNYLTVALISVCIGDYRCLVEDNPSFASSVDTLSSARRAIWIAAMEAIGIFAVLIIISAGLIPHYTKPLDPRMGNMIEGFSRILAFVYQAVLSIRVAIWIGLYGNPMRADLLQKNLGTSIVELKHRVRWSVSKRFLRSLFLLMILFQGADQKTIPFSVLFGLIFGVMTDVGISYGRRLQWGYRRNCFSICFVIVLIVVALIMLVSGAMFIASVWESNVDDAIDTSWDAYAFIIGLILLPFIHVMVWLLGRKNQPSKQDIHDWEGRPSGHAKSGADRQDEEETGGPSGPRDEMARQRAKRARMATSMIVSDFNLFKKDHAPAVEADKSAAIEVGGEEEEEVVEEQANPLQVEEQVSENENGDSKLTQEEGQDPTLWELLMDWQCCGCARGDDKSVARKTYNVVVMTLYLAMCGIAILSLVCNIGSTYQQERVRRKLPVPTLKLYTNMGEGPVCAIDQNMTETSITSFDSKDEAHEAGFFIVHCGACAACSDWHNLQLEYTTRNFLAAESKDCAQQSLFGGGDPALLECLKKPKIGFQGRCAECWQEDIICTKKFCWAIGLQSFFINTLSNFAVGPGTITSATCEEANCEGM